MNLFAEDDAAKEVIKLFGLGYTGKEIQDRLKISPREFDTIAKRIHRKLDSEYDRRSA